MTAYRLDLVFRDIDRDDDTLDLLETIPDVHWVFQSGAARAVATVYAASAIDAANWLISQVTDRVASARPGHLDRDFVAIPDVADRLGVNRETVRSWVKGSRRGGASFPAPTGVVGDGIMIWPWPVVNEWADRNVSLGDGFVRATEAEACQIDLLCAQWSRRLAGVETHQHWSLMIEQRCVAVVSHSAASQDYSPEVETRRTFKTQEFALA